VRRRVELVDEGERVAGGLRDGHHPPPDGVHVPATAEGVEARGRVGERGAGPCLHVAQAPRELPAPGAAHPLHLRRRLPEPRLRVARHLRAVASAAAEVGGPAARAVGSHQQRRTRQPTRAAAHRRRAGEKGALAHARVPRPPARAPHEVRRRNRAHRSLLVLSGIRLRHAEEGEEDRHKVEAAASHPLSLSLAECCVAGAGQRKTEWSGALAFPWL
jgi:hypothetical protein